MRPPIGTRARRRWLVPLRIQRTLADCGPTVLAAALEGYGRSADMEALRALAGTGADGTSVDALERAAQTAGLEAAQLLEPAEHLLRSERGALPAIVVVSHEGTHHFALAWRVVGGPGGRVMLLDPALGRRWLTRAEFLASAVSHAMPLPARQWRAFAGRREFLLPLEARLHALGIEGTALLDAARADPDWQGLAALDAAARAVERLATTGAVRGTGAARLVEACFDEARRLGPSTDSAVAPEDWLVRPIGTHPALGPVLLTRGIVVVHLRGVNGTDQAAPALRGRERRARMRGRARLAASRTWARVPVALTALGLALAGAGAAIEALALGAGGALGRGAAPLLTRAHGPAVLLALAVLFFVDGGTRAALLGLGRAATRRLRESFAAKLPLLGESFVVDRSSGDTVSTAFGLDAPRREYGALGQLARDAGTLAATLMGLALASPSAAVRGAVVALVLVGLPLLLLGTLRARGLQASARSGALGGLLFDALRAVLPIRAQRAEHAFTAEFDEALHRWQAADARQRSLARSITFGTTLAGSLGAFWIVAGAVRGGSVELLLGLYFALRLPAVAASVAASIGQLGAARLEAHRAREVLSFPEALGAPEWNEAMRARGEPRREGASSVGEGVGVRWELEGVSVGGEGAPILAGLSLVLDAGEHVAVVGASGSGKSTLVRLLLGLTAPERGELRADGTVLDARRAVELRAATAWVEPDVQLWRESMADNLAHGPYTRGAANAVASEPVLAEVVAALPLGLASLVGEGGAGLGGGEAQAVRLGRASAQAGVRQALLDEPFRGLPRETRPSLLAAARERWRSATVVYVTHEPHEALGFARVLVLAGGHLVESGSPTALAGDPSSAFSRLLRSERETSEHLRDSAAWHRIRLGGPRLAQPGAPTPDASRGPL